ncbi:MAG: LPS export ABC transporter permease LptF [Kiloniellaceae bacterium]
MQGINRYIFNQLLAATVAITVGLTFAVWLTQSLRLFDFIVNRGLPASTFFSFVALLLPSFVGIVLPIATFCAVLFVYHKLIMDSELVVLRAAGLSQLQLGRPAFRLALVATLVVYSISLYFLPASYRAFKDLQYRLRDDFSTVLLQEGAFNTVTDGITVYVRDRTPKGELLGILVHDTRDPEKPVTMMAERGALVQSETGPRVVMVNGNRQQREDDSGRVSLLYFDRYTVELARLQETVHTRWREPKERYLGELFNPTQHPSDQYYRKELVAEGHQRLIMPLYTVAFVLIGLAALLSGEFNRRGQTRRVLLAIFIVALLEAQSLTLHDLAVGSTEAIPAMYAGVGLPILGGLAVLLRRPRRRAARGDTAQAAVQ